MGNQQVKFQEETLQEFEETTPFNRAEITHAFVRFTDLYNAFYRDSTEMNSPHHIRNNHGFANPLCSLPLTYIMDELPELKNNPFKYRICKAFCVSDSGQMNFTEFLDMVSSFSPKADIEKKIYHAFQIFDVDGDGLLSRNDLYTIMDMMAGIVDEPLTNEVDKKGWDRVKNWMIDGVFFECNKRETVRTKSSGNDDQESGLEELTLEEITENEEGKKILNARLALTIEDFRYCIYRSPDFKSIFSFKI